ncbi:MAG: hypothetical protein M5U34_16760 [Chloroflexi bacterium]|nr:hypothetical protein [Chloroflexota bacterium]
MTTLHFNTDAGRETATALGTTRENLEAEVTALVNRVNGLVGSEWQGNSAVVFRVKWKRGATNYAPNWALSLICKAASIQKFPIGKQRPLTFSFQRVQCDNITKWRRSFCGAA